jgi:hypothetical protein
VGNGKKQKEKYIEGGYKKYCRNIICTHRRKQRYEKIHTGEKPYGCK